jgi:hypothetical protein
LNFEFYESGKKGKPKSTKTLSFENMMTMMFSGFVTPKKRNTSKTMIKRYFQDRIYRLQDTGDDNDHGQNKTKQATQNKTIMLFLLSLPATKTKTTTTKQNKKTYIPKKRYRR